MRNITFRAKESLIEQARRAAGSRHKTLNVAFRECLEQYAAQGGTVAAVDAPARRLQKVRSAGRYSRDEMTSGVLPWG